MKAISVWKKEGTNFGKILFFHFGHENTWIRIRFDLKCWIRICIEINMDPKHWLCHNVSSSLSCVFTETNEDRLFTVCNNGLSLLYDAFNILHLMHHEATACHVTQVWMKNTRSSPGEASKCLSSHSGSSVTWLFTQETIGLPLAWTRCMAYLSVPGCHHMHLECISAIYFFIGVYCVT